MLMDNLKGNALCSRQSRDELRLYLIKRKLTHFLHKIQDVLLPISELERQFSDIFGIDLDQVQSEVKAKLDDFRESSQPHNEDSMEHSQTLFLESEPESMSSCSSMSQSHELVDDKSKENSYNRGVLKFLENSYRQKNALAKPQMQLDDNNNNDNHKDFNQDNYEDKEAPKSEDDDPTAYKLRVKAIPKEEMKLMNFFNSIYSFNNPHSASHFLDYPNEENCECIHVFRVALCKDNNCFRYDHKRSLSSSERQLVKQWQ